jgi:hypothetical protein
MPQFMRVTDGDAGHIGDVVAFAPGSEPQTRPRSRARIFDSPEKAIDSACDDPPDLASSLT